VKQENVLLTKQGGRLHAKIADLGLFLVRAAQMPLLEHCLQWCRSLCLLYAWLPNGWPHALVLTCWVGMLAPTRRLPPPPPALHTGAGSPHQALPAAPQGCCSRGHHHQPKQPPQLRLQEGQPGHRVSGRCPAVCRGKRGSERGLGMSPLGSMSREPEQWSAPVKEGSTRCAAASQTG